MKDQTKQKLLEEISVRRNELVQLMKKQGGGTVAIRLKVDNVDFCYRKDRKPEPFYITGVLNGIPVIINESMIWENEHHIHSDDSGTFSCPLGSACEEK